jgi:hypothetical protein
MTDKKHFPLLGATFCMVCCSVQEDYNPCHRCGNVEMMRVFEIHAGPAGKDEHRTGTTTFSGDVGRVMSDEELEAILNGKGIRR